MGSKQPIAFIPRQREEKNVWYVLLSPRRINNTHTTYLNGFRGSCEIHPPLQLTVAKRPKRLRQVAGTCKMMVVGRFATKPPAFCMVLLMLCTLLLMTESLSAVPHGNEQTIGENIAVTCSGEFVLYHNFCYRYFGHTHRPFHHAEKLCTRYQSSLVSIHSPHEEEFVVQLAENNTSFWIGLNDEDGPASHHKEGVFKWTDGNILTNPVSYQNWSPGEPSNRRHLDCVKASRKGWAMAQGGCAASRLPFVCKKQGCPPGFDWSGNSCDKTRDESKMAHPDWLFSYCTLFKVTIIAVLLTAVALISVTICSYTRTRRTSSRHQELYPT